MTAFKKFLEKPFWIWVLIILAYSAWFWFSQTLDAPLRENEMRAFDILTRFADEKFPPPMILIKELPDWGSTGYYLLFGRMFSVLKGNIQHIRMAHFFMVSLCFFLFMRLGFWFTMRNRLSPLWISVGLLLLAVNPHFISVSETIGPGPLALFFLLLSALCFERGLFGWMGIFLAVGVSINCYGLLLALSFSIARLLGERSRLIRPERVLCFLAPWVMAAVLFCSWKGPVPQGEARAWFHELLINKTWFRVDKLWYQLCLLPLYGVGVVWFWAIRARSRQLLVGLYFLLVLLPFFFFVPISGTPWVLGSFLQEFGGEMGLVDKGAILVAGPYKNFLLFFPWVAGAYLFFQLFLTDVLDRSRWLKVYIVSYFLFFPIWLFQNPDPIRQDVQFIYVLPFALLFTLSESLIGEQGKLS